MSLERGSKADVPEVLRTHVSLRRYLPEQLNFGIHHVPANLQNEVRNLIRRVGAKVIVRTTNRQDWKGLVDAMPTQVSEIEFINQTVNRAKKICLTDKDFLAYANAEAAELEVDFDPNATNFVFQEYFPTSPDSPGFTFTEHPNQSDVSLVDFMFENDRGGIHHGYFDLQGGIVKRTFGNATFAQAFQPKIELVQNMITDIRETGEFDPLKALQYEGGIVDGQPKLYQVREFADIKMSDKQSFEDGNSVNYRNFGIVNGITTTRLTTDCINDYLSLDSKDGEYIFEVFSGDGRVLPKGFPSKMKGFIFHGITAMSHKNTRFVQAVLRRGGFASLIDDRFGSKTGMKPYEDRVTAFADGRNVWIKKAA